MAIMTQLAAIWLSKIKTFKYEFSDILLNMDINKEYLFIFSLFFLVLLIFGCSQSQSTGLGESVQVGTEGIVMNFVNNAPPSEIFYDPTGGNEFEATVELKNKGTFPREGTPLVGQLFITGFDTSVINGAWEGGDSLPSTLTGKSLVFPEGGYDIKTYLDSDLSYPFDSDTYPTPVQVTACYQYETMATPLVCVDPNPTSTTIRKKVCNVHDLTLSGGQGGPVGITSIEQFSGSRKSTFKITIENLGNGRVIAYDRYADCLDLEFRDVDRVEVTTQLTGQNGDCNPEGTASNPVRLINGKGLIVCNFDNPTSGDAFSTPLQVNMKYGYSNSISKQINIIKMEN